MPGPQTAEMLIQLVRENVGVFDKQKLLDGYPSERRRFADAPSILSAVNRALNDFEVTHFNKCEFTFPVEEGVREYPMTRAAHEIDKTAWIQDLNEPPNFFPLPMDSFSQQVDANGGMMQWNRVRTTLPTSFYMVGTKKFVLTSTPSQSNLYVVHYIASTVVSDLVLPTDIPGAITDVDGNPIVRADGYRESSLPEYFQMKLSVGASGYILESLGRSDDATKRLTEHNEVIIPDLKKLVNSRVKPDLRRLALRNPLKRFSRGGIGIRR
jgi:hypothetical protein